MSTTFEYRALDAAGRMLTGTIEAESRAAVMAQLDQAGFTPLAAEARGPAGEARRWRDLLTPEPRPNDITAMTLDLAMLLRGGVALTDALMILAQLDTRRWLVRVLRDLHLSLSQGRSLSQAVARHPRLFPPIYRKMVEVAEAAGRLEQALTSLAAERQRSERLRRRFVSAIAYPLFLVAAALAVLAFVLIYLIPKFEVALQGFRDRIDPSALFVFNLSAVVNGHLDLIVLGLAGLLGGGMVLARIGRERGLWIGLLARLPVTGTLLAHELTVTFCRTLAILVGGGVDISTALRLIRGVVRLPGAGAEIDRVIADVRQGQRLSEALGQRRLFPRHVVQMLRVGEEAGELPDSAGRVAEFYETKLDAALGRLIAIVGPAVMVLVSLLIAWLIISVMTALMSINDLLT
ncbi:type II secretion system F family protein [Methylobacterium nodulans]|uniref:Type II secretion system protein n=1 Tax=Methylobacterium nodulans (strain LMG 21967 / CNCM I-2342 / ORS 2060) TaxID=460265 RepID=B8IR81_METNO|nr:type II secretion system F family protein [Methylobacterium nodulans]ACL56783.1 type II secretion system protein [Methylobacterium nodulans ORS 2060]